jgi:hypothetical protein
MKTKKYKKKKNDRKVVKQKEKRNRYKKGVKRFKG